MGPKVSKAKALDPSEELRQRIVAAQATDGSQRRGPSRLGSRVSMERGDRLPAPRNRGARRGPRRPTRLLRDAEGRQGAGLPARRRRHAARRGRRRRHRQDADHRTRREARRAASRRRRLQVREPSDPRLQALAGVVCGVGEDRQEAAAVRDDREHGGGRPDRPPPEQRSALQGSKRQDDQPPHQPQGQAEEARDAARRPIYEFVEARRTSATRTSRPSGSSRASSTTARAPIAASSRC